MHADYLNVTMPDGDAPDVESELLKIVAAVGGTSITDGLYKLTSGGTFRSEAKRNFHYFGVSGDFLATLREHALYDAYLGAVAYAPHKVTRLDIAHDVYDSDSPAVLARLVRATRSEKGVRLSRKKLNPQTQVRTMFSMSDDGRDTGLVYLGGRTAEVKAKVYDKRLERKQVANVDFPACTRFELTVTDKVGVSLRDAQSPEAIFWNFMSEVLPAPPDASEWVKGG